MKVNACCSGCIDFKEPLKLKRLSEETGNVELSKDIKYTALPAIAFGSQIAQIKPVDSQLNPLDEAKTWSKEGIEYAKEWPIPAKSLEILNKRFEDALKFNQIDKKEAPGLAVYNLSSNGRQYMGFYDSLTNKLTITEGAVLFDIDKKASVLDEALAHESYHCQRAHFISAISDDSLTEAIDNRLMSNLTEGRFPAYDIVTGEKFQSLSKETAQALVKFTKDENEPSDEALEKLTDFMTDYTPKSKRFVIRLLDNLRAKYEKNTAIGYEPALKANLFSMEEFTKLVPEKVIEKIMLSKGIPTKEEAVAMIVREKPGKLILMGYLSQKDADKAKDVRQKILNDPNKPSETEILKELDSIFDMIDAAYNLSLAGNDKSNNINQPKVMEEYMYCNEEINARQAGLTHKINLLEKLIETTEPPVVYKYQTAIETAWADYQLNEVMKELVRVRKESPENTSKVEELSQQATKLARKAEYTVPKITGKKNEPYVPFSYGESYRLPSEVK
jgi:hypothetical protein